MFVTITLNPAIDCTLQVSGSLQIGAVHKTVSETLTPGGKGVNVAKTLACAGQNTVAAGLLGVSDVATYSAFLADLGVESSFLPVPHATRRNIMAVDESGNELKLNRPGFPELEFDWTVLKQYCAQLLRKGDVFIISGSLPAMFPVDTCAKLIRFFKDAGKFTVLDAEGGALEAGLEAGPDIIKPNMAEIKGVREIDPGNRESIIKVLEGLAKKHEVVIITNGSSETWFASGNRIFTGAPPHVRAVDSTGAGDAFLGRFCADYFCGGHALSDSAMRMALAAGAAAVELEGTPPPSNERVMELAECVELYEK